MADQIEKWCQFGRKEEENKIKKDENIKGKGKGRGRKKVLEDSGLISNTEEIYYWNFAHEEKINILPMLHTDNETGRSTSNYIINKLLHFQYGHFMLKQI